MQLIYTLVRKANICSHTHSHTCLLCRSFVRSCTLSQTILTLAKYLYRFCYRIGFFSPHFTVRRQSADGKSIVLHCVTISNPKFRDYKNEKGKKRLAFKYNTISIFWLAFCAFSPQIHCVFKRDFFIWFLHIRFAVGLRFSNRFIYLLLILVSLLWFCMFVRWLVWWLGLTFRVHKQ